MISSFILIIFLYPRNLKKKIVYFEVLKEKDIPKKGVKIVTFSYQKGKRNIKMKAFIVNHNGELFALSPVCTHLGCFVNWHSINQQFICPCHGGKYDITGNVIGGPPPAPLTRLAFKIENSKVYIGLKL